MGPYSAPFFDEIDDPFAEYLSWVSSTEEEPLETWEEMKQEDAGFKYESVPFTAVSVTPESVLPLGRANDEQLG